MNLTKDFFIGGNSTFTVQNGKGEYFTFRIRKPKTDSPYFVSLCSGAESFVYVGILNPETGSVKLTHKSKVDESSVSYKVVKWALMMVWTNKTLPNGYQIRHEGKCGCCGKALTTPESLDRGIGPECFKRMFKKLVKN